MYPCATILTFYVYNNASLKSSTIFLIFILCTFRAEDGVKLTYNANSHAQGNKPYDIYFLDEV